MILQKYIAQSGYCSRRKAEELIKAGKVIINGQVAEPGMEFKDGDEIRIAGKKIILRSEEKIYIILNKPKGYTCTKRRFEGEKNVFDLIKTDLFDVKVLNIAGRLDKDSRGLVLLTNDGDLLYKMTHPRFGHEKEYGVNVKGQMSQPKAGPPRTENVKTVEDKILKGIDIGEGDGVVKAKEVKYLGVGKFRVVLAEGKKRQIRRMFGALGLEVVDLQRVRIGGIKMGDLEEGGWKIYNL